MTSHNIPPDAACDTCRRSAERLAELEEQLEAAGVARLIEGRPLG